MECLKVMKSVDFIEPDIPKENPHLPEGTPSSNTSGKQKKRKAIENKKKNVKKSKSMQPPDHDGTSASQETNASSQRSHLTALSQPPQRIRHRERLLWLQDRRDTGIWVNCDTCKNWGYLPSVHDPLELPEKWNCSMNPDAKYSTCFGKEKKLQIADEEDLIHNEYSAGSVVWAKMSGFPWWPAMVDDCPEVEQYYWLDGFSDIPTYYNVVFFDSASATRCWVTPDCLKPFNTTQSSAEAQPPNKYKTRLHIARNQAKDAKALPIKERLKKYCFVNRYNGSINSPIKPTKKQKRDAKLKYFSSNVQEFIDTSSSDSSRRSSMCMEQPEQKILNNTAPQAEENNPNSNATDSQAEANIPSSNFNAPRAEQNNPNRNATDSQVEANISNSNAFDPIQESDPCKSFTDLDPVSLVFIENLLQQNNTPELISSQSSFVLPATPRSLESVTKKKADKRFAPPMAKNVQTKNFADTDDISIQNRKTVRMVIDSGNTEEMRSDKAECGDSNDLFQSSECRADDSNILNMEFTERDFDLLNKDAIVPNTSEEVANLDCDSQNSDDFDFKVDI